MDVEPAPKSGGSAMVPVAIALIGVALGGAALYFTLNGRTTGEQALDDLRAELAAAQAGAGDAAQKVAALEAKITSLTQTTANLGASVQSLQASTETAVTTLSNAIREDRAALLTLDESVKTVVTRLSAPPAPPPPPTPAAGGATAAGGASAASGAAGAPPAASGEARVHVIQSGDILSTVARTYGVSLAALLEANPGIDPNRLQIGQKINIPPPAPARGAPPPASP